jgi:hypothetical protein
LSELTSQVLGALWMQLNRNDTPAGRDERASYRASSGTHVEDKVSGSAASVCDEAAGPTVIELMAAPPRPADGGHGGSSPCSTSWAQP